MEKLLFLVNPSSGKGRIRYSLFEITDIFTKAGYDVTVHPIQSGESSADYVREYGLDYDMIVCAGGDGTLNKLYSGYLCLRGDVSEQDSDAKLPSVGYIPCGSTNDFARSIGISLRPLAAARQAADGSPVLIDAGMFRDEAFVYIAAFGLFTQTSYATPQTAKNVLGHSAYVFQGIRELSEIRNYEIEAEFDGKKVTGSYIYGQITNSRSVGGVKVLRDRTILFSDGVFECLLIKEPGTIEELRGVINAFLTGEIDSDLMIFERASRIKISSNGSIPWVIDGEYAGEYKDAEIIVEHNAIPFVLGNEV